MRKRRKLTHKESEALATARASQGLTLEKIGAILGVEASTVGRWENRETSISEFQLTALRAAVPGVEI